MYSSQNLSGQLSFYFQPSKSLAKSTYLKQNLHSQKGRLRAVFLLLLPIIFALLLAG